MEDLKQGLISMEDKVNVSMKDDKYVLEINGSTLSIKVEYITYEAFLEIKKFSEMMYKNGFRDASSIFLNKNN